MQWTDLPSLDGYEATGDRTADFTCPKCKRGKCWALRKAPDVVKFGCRECGAKTEDIEALFKAKSNGHRNGVPAAVPAPVAVRARAASGASPPGTQPDFLRRVPPHNLEAEQSVLGAILLENKVIKPLLEVIGYEDFYREAHRHIYRAMVALSMDNEPIDAITLTSFLRDKGVLEAIGGPAYIADLAAAVPTALNAEQYARIVREKSVLRQLASHATEIASAAYENESPAKLVELMNRAASMGELSRTTLPILIGKQMLVYTGKQLRERRASQVRHWIVDGLLAEKEVSLWSGKVEGGKTTLLRTLCFCVLRGVPFLERTVLRGRVLYAMLDADGEDQTYEEFERLGVDWDRDHILTIIDPVLSLRPQSFDQFYAEIKRFKPSLVVVDTLGRLQQADDMLDYGMTYQMARLSELARLTGVHIAALHHIPRGRADNADVATAAFGSVAVAGGVNARFVCLHKPGDIYTLSSSKGKSGGFKPFDGEQTLDMDPETGFINLRGPYSYKDQARGLIPQVKQMLEQSEERMTAHEMAAEIGARRSLVGMAAQMLYKDGGCRRDGVGRGKDGKFTFWIDRQGGLLNDTPDKA